MCPTARLAVLAVLVAAALPLRAATPPEQSPLAMPLTNARLAAPLRAAAARDHISLLFQTTANERPEPGDAVVFWVGTAQGRETEQWLVQLSRGTASAKERAAHRGHAVTKYLSWGPVVTFNSAAEPLDLWIAGPVVTTDPAGRPVPARPEVPTRRARVYVQMDYLRLGLDGSVRAYEFIRSRTAALARQDPAFRLGYIYALDHAISPEAQRHARPIADRLGLTPEMARAWAGGYVALQAFYEAAERVRSLNEIADVACVRPSVWSLTRVAFGTKFMTGLGGRTTQPIDPAKAGLLPVKTETFNAPFRFAFGDDPIVSGSLAVTAPRPPLDVAGGILGIVAVNPKDRTHVVELLAIGASSGGGATRSVPARSGGSDAMGAQAGRAGGSSRPHAIAKSR